MYRPEAADEHDVVRRFWIRRLVSQLCREHHIRVGENNPGAIGLQFYSNNSGAVRNCRFRAGSNSGLIGLDLGHRDMNGPLLVRNCEVVGFELGIKHHTLSTVRRLKRSTCLNKSDLALITRVKQSRCGGFTARTWSRRYEATERSA